MAPTPNGGRQFLCGNSQFAAEEAAADFPARPRQGAARRPTSPAMSAGIPSIHAIYRYPVKGLSPEPLTRTRLAVGETLPADRLYAIENGPSGFDPSAPAYLSKQHFLMLMKNERLAALRTAFDQRATCWASRTVRAKPRGAIFAPIRAARESTFFATSFADELHGVPKIRTLTATASPTSPAR